MNTIKDTDRTEMHDNPAGDELADFLMKSVAAADGTAAMPPPTEHLQIEADGEPVIVSAKDRLVLRCGKASITLTKEGKLLIEGTYVSSHSSGVNRIRGGSVQIN